jgi:uncharacterized damage-inducible protein DinB
MKRRSDRLRLDNSASESENIDSINNPLMTKNALTSLLLFFLITHSFDSEAQALRLDDVKNQMIKDWTRAKAFTLAYLNAMPKEKYNFKPVNEVQSFGQQMIHLAVVDMFLVSMASETEPQVAKWADFGTTASSQTKDSVLYYVTASYDYCINAIATLDSKRWGEKKQLSGKQKTRFELLDNAFEHQSHHRGQTTIYLRLVGIIPPEANLF